MSWPTVTFVKNSCTKTGKEPYEKMRVYMPKGSEYEDYYFTISHRLVSETTNTVMVIMPWEYKFTLSRGKNRTEKKYRRITMDVDEFTESVSKFKPEFNMHLAELKVYRNNGKRNAGATERVDLEIGSVEGKWFHPKSGLRSQRRLINSRGVTILKELTPEDVELFNKWESYKSVAGEASREINKLIRDFDFAIKFGIKFVERKKPAIFTKWMEDNIPILNGIKSEIEATEKAMLHKLLSGVEV